MTFTANLSTPIDVGRRGKHNLLFLTTRLSKVKAVILIIIFSVVFANWYTAIVSRRLSKEQSLLFWYVSCFRVFCSYTPDQCTTCAPSPETKYQWHDGVIGTEENFSLDNAKAAYFNLLISDVFSICYPVGCILLQEICKDAGEI